jgi:hypothetical protein
MITWASLPLQGVALDVLREDEGPLDVSVMTGCGSSKNHEMESPAEKSTPLVSPKEAADDIETVIR